jgi:lysophospholipid acyltransferase (LPLAT)-like uncharacterized protein
VSSALDSVEDGDSRQDDAPESDVERDASARTRLTRPTPTKQKRERPNLRYRLRALIRGVALTFGSIGIRLLSMTWRPVYDGTENLEAARGDGGGHFVTIWHGRMLVPMAHHRGRKWTVLVSKSRDGEVAVQMLLRFGYQVIRGSTSRGGAKALREMMDALRAGEVLILTPDGPRGPMHSMSPGLVWMARATGYAVVPGGFVANRAWRAKSWDRFTLPKPFSRLAFVYGPPISVPRDSTNDDLEKASLAIRDAMLAAERRGCELLGMEPES